QAPAPRLFAAARHPYTRALLASAPRPDPDRKRGAVSVQGEVPSPAAPPPGCAFHPRCPRALRGTCDREAPPLEEVEPGSGHKLACWNPAH
ncbi:MAG: peptide ABC transporter substrate-binding protein, partial [Myxococcales bacterium]|nr:peptide ABC transporter substrate-binding protein [Myxococcales bacterium]